MLKNNRPTNPISVYSNYINVVVICLYMQHFQHLIKISFLKFYHNIKYLFGWLKSILEVVGHDSWVS